MLSRFALCEGQCALQPREQSLSWHLRVRAVVQHPRACVKAIWLGPSASPYSLVKDSAFVGEVDKVVLPGCTRGATLTLVLAHHRGGLAGSGPGIASLESLCPISNGVTRVLFPSKRKRYALADKLWNTQ